MLKDYENYYKWGLMSKNDLAIAVVLPDDSLTAAQYLEITGEEYVAPEVTSVITELKKADSAIETALNLTGDAIVNRVQDIEAAVELLKGGI